jgi:hypothetical protein
MDGQVPCLKLLFLLLVLGCGGQGTVRGHGGKRKRRHTRRGVAACTVETQEEGPRELECAGLTE